eukprot:1032749-Prymnesium_polylepis.1
MGSPTILGVADDALAVARLQGCHQVGPVHRVWRVVLRLHLHPRAPNAVANPHKRLEHLSMP